MSVSSTTHAPYNTVPDDQKKSKKPSDCCIEMFKTVKGFIFHPDLPSWTSSICGLARAVHSVSKPMFSVLSKLNRGLAATQFTSVITMPFDLYQVVLGSANLVREKGKHARLDNALGIIGDASQLGDGIATFFTGITDLGGLASTATYVTSPLAFVSCLVSCIFFVIHGRGIYYNARLLKEIKSSAVKNDLASNLVTIKKRTYHLKRQCGVDTDLFIKTIKSVNALPDSQIKESQLQKSYQILRTRIKQKAFSHSLGILIMLISVTAGFLFFATLFTPFAPIGIAGSAFLIPLFILSMGKMAAEVYFNRQFKKRLQPLTLRQQHAIA